MILTVLLAAQINLSNINESSKPKLLTQFVQSEDAYAKKGGKGKGGKGKNGKGKGGKGKGNKGKGGKGKGNKNDSGGSKGSSNQKNCTTAQKNAIFLAAEESYIDCETLAYNLYSFHQERYDSEVKKCQKQYDAAIRVCK